MIANYIQNIPVTKSNTTMWNKWICLYFLIIFQSSQSQSKIIIKRIVVENNWKYYNRSFAKWMDSRGVTFVNSTVELLLKF